MKMLLLPLVLVFGNVVACPADGSKDAMAPAAGKSVVATKTAPMMSMPADGKAVAKAPSKVAAKTGTEARKTSSL